MTTLETPGSTQTLAYRLTLGRIPVPEALRYAMLLAESLRKVHEAGQVHGAVSPASIAITRTGIELLPALGSAGEITPYTAPEVVEGRPADARSDVFAFGTILYEMLTGRPAFASEGAALAAALTSGSPAPSGSPAVDRLVANCIAKDPAARCQRMQKLLLELKLLAVAVQRAESRTPRRELVDPAPALRAEIAQAESRLAARIGSLEAVVQESLAGFGRLKQAIDERFEQFDRSASEALAGVEKAAGERIARLEQAGGAHAERVDRSIDGIRREAASLRESVADDLAVFDKSLKSQNAAIESARTAMAQTDDLVERVVDALESLQTVVLEHAEDRNS